MRERISDLSQVTVIRRSDNVVVDMGRGFYKQLWHGDSVNGGQRDLAVVIVREDNSRFTYNTEHFYVSPRTFGELAGRN